MPRLLLRQGLAGHGEDVRGACALPAAPAAAAALATCSRDRTARVWSREVRGWTRRPTMAPAT